MYESNDFNLIHLFFQTMLLEASVSTEGQVFNIFLDNDLCSYTSVTKKKKGVLAGLLALPDLVGDICISIFGHLKPPWHELSKNI